ncbi:MAG: C1 family peptidase [Thermodesulfobacteriota bacterium]
MGINTGKLRVPLRQPVLKRAEGAKNKKRKDNPPPPKKPLERLGFIWGNAQAVIDKCGGKLPNFQRGLGQGPVLRGSWWDYAGGSWTDYAGASWIDQAGGSWSDYAGARGGGSTMVSTGYMPDLQDARDYSLDQIKAADMPEAVRKTLDDIKLYNARLALDDAAFKKLPAKQQEAEVKKASDKFKSFLLRDLPISNAPDDRVDLTQTGMFSPIENQEDMSSCTAQAVMGLVEYLMGWSGAYTDHSRMFLYKTTRRLMGLTGDTGASIRSSIKAMKLFGVPPENEWPYDRKLLDTEPDAFLYSYAQNFKATTYARLDGYRPESTSEETLNTIKRCLADGFPVAFGFAVYTCIQRMQADCVIPYPDIRRRPSNQRGGDKFLGGHAVLAVGYDNSIPYVMEGAEKKGALIIRNSWGGGWGDQGYAYLPYAYVLNYLAEDFWTIFNSEWLDLHVFD